MNTQKMIDRCLGKNYIKKGWVPPPWSEMNDYEERLKEEKEKKIEREKMRNFVKKLNKSNSGDKK